MRGGLVTDQGGYNVMRHDIMNSGVVAVDTETTGLHPYTVDEIRGISVGAHEWAWYLPISHPDSKNFDPAELLRSLKPKTLVFHHAPFDWAFLDQVDPTFGWADSTAWDTQVVNWMLDENLKTGLKESSERIFGYDAGAEKKALAKITKDTGRTWHSFTAEDIGQYAAMDATLTWNLYVWQLNNLHNVTPEIPLAAVFREVEVQRSLYRMMKRGVKADPERIIEGEGAFMEKVSKLEQTFVDAGINPNSTKQVGAYLFGGGESNAVTVKTATGKPSTAKNVLLDLAERGSPMAKALLDHRHLSKAVTGYFRPMQAQIGEDGRIHPHFSSTRTVTGRFSCSAPNLQTIPRDDTMPEVRRCFVPAEGYKLYGFDLKQAELRVIAGYAKEPAMIEALEQGRDLHDETAESIFGPDFTDLQRRLAKNLNFGFAYGIGPAKFATYINPVPNKADVEMARDILAGYKRTYPKVAALLVGMEKVAKRRGFVPSGWPGRFRRFRGPYAHLPARLKPQTYTAVNYIVQGGIGEFMKDVMNAWYEYESDEWTRLVLQVHDELVFEVRDDECLNIRVGGVQMLLQGIADRLKPFTMRMEWDVKRWE